MLRQFFQHRKSARETDIQTSEPGPARLFGVSKSDSIKRTNHVRLDRPYNLRQNPYMARPYNAPDVFRAIAHPVRRRMLESLRSGPRTAAELGQPFRMTRASISEHLRALRIAGLISTHSRGAYVMHTLVRSQLASVERWITEFKSSKA